MFVKNFYKTLGFTLIELLVVMAIIGVLASIVAMSVQDSRTKGRDAARKTQIQEVLKALELYFTTDGVYPYFGVAGVNTGGNLSGIEPSFFSSTQFMTSVPPEAATHYYYCVSADRKSILLAVNTEQDKGGSNYCSVTRGPGPYGCAVWYAANATTLCTSRF